jgi:hypothetical protein
MLQFVDTAGPHKAHVISDLVQHAMLHGSSLEILAVMPTPAPFRSRLRNGGEQKIIVKHVTVNEGGQAIVGTVNSRAHEVER